MLKAKRHEPQIDQGSSDALFKANRLLENAQTNRKAEVQYQVLAERKLARECARTLEKAIGRGYEARVVFYPPDK